MTLKILSATTAVLFAGVGAASATSTSEKIHAKHQYYHAVGYIKAIGKNARRTQYSPVPTVRRRWQAALHYLAGVRDRNYLIMHPPPPAVVISYTGGVALCGYSCVQCESTHNPQAWSPDGKYWGLYQFDHSTWAAHGGVPSHYGHAGAAEQTAVASRITYDAWPNC